jgi:hypothetical protein
MTELKLNVKSPEFAATIVSVLMELSRAEAKHPNWPSCNIRRAAIVAEESGELIREANLLDEGKGSLDRLKAECIETAVTCLRMLDALSADEKELKSMYGEYMGEH